MNQSSGKAILLLAETRVFHAVALHQFPFFAVHPLVVYGAVIGIQLVDALPNSENAVFIGQVLFYLLAILCMAWSAIMSGIFIAYSIRGDCGKPKGDVGRWSFETDLVILLGKHQFPGAAVREKKYIRKTKEEWTWQSFQRTH